MLVKSCKTCKHTLYDPENQSGYRGCEAGTYPFPLRRKGKFTDWTKVVCELYREEEK